MSTCEIHGLFGHPRKAKQHYENVMSLTVTNQRQEPSSRQRAEGAPTLVTFLVTS